MYCRCQYIGLGAATPFLPLTYRKVCGIILTYRKREGTMAHKEIREIEKQILAKNPGFSIVDGGKHRKVKNETGGTVYTLPTTPGGGRWKETLLSDLRRKGLI